MATIVRWVDDGNIQQIRALSKDETRPKADKLTNVRGGSKTLKRRKCERYRKQELSSGVESADSSSPGEEYETAYVKKKAPQAKKKNANVKEKSPVKKKYVNHAKWSIDYILPPTIARQAQTS